MVNAFANVTVSVPSFPVNPQFTIPADAHLPQRGPYYGLVLLWKSGVKIEYSFDGTTLHGDLEDGLLNEGLTFDHRPIPLGIWFRAASSSVVRVEAWAEP